MHSRIIQIESRPLEEDDYITPCAYNDDHWFTHSIADYVTEDEDRAGSIQWFKESLSICSEHIEYFVENGCEGFILHEGFYAAHMKPAFEDFMAQLNQLAKTLDFGTFIAGNLGATLFTLNSTYDDEFGFYIEAGDSCPVTLNHFLRYAKPGIRYYFGGTLDYHS